jgi:hypothetical protein
MALITDGTVGDGGGGAPTNVHVLTTQAEAGLSAESNLGALTTGLLKIDVSGGVATPSTAVAGTDYASPALKYITAQAESGLSAEVNLGALTTGLLKHTVAGGVSTPATAVANTDYLAPDWDVISRQTLGADAQEITFTVDGDADERVEIDGFGESNATGHCLLKFGSTTLDVTKIISAGGASPTGSATNGIGSSIADEAMGFRLVLDLRRQGTCDRGGWAHFWIGYGASSEEYYLTGVVYHDTSTNITSIVLSGTVANFFASGFKAICRRKKMS